MLNNKDIADRRECFYKPDYIQIEEKVKKRDKKMLTKEAANEEFKEFSIPAENLVCQEDSESNSSNKVIELRPDGRPKRDIKKKKHFDEQYPPEEQTPKRKKHNNRGLNRKSSLIDTPTLFKKRSSRRTKVPTKDSGELNSDDEEYKMANKRVKPMKGRTSSSFII